MHHDRPTRLSSAVFAAKALAHRGLRFVADRKLDLRAFPRGNSSDYPVLLAESRSPLWTSESLVEQQLQFGKVQNLRRACSRLNRVQVPAGSIFSFWSQIGKASKRAGFVAGRELRQGCLIPSVGGGLCQLSNALYDLALRSGCEIIERHPHTGAVPGSEAERDRDATVFWNYVDLRFRARMDLFISASLTRDELVVSFRGRQQPLTVLLPASAHRRDAAAVNSCTDCGREDCFRHVAATIGFASRRAAFLIDECWPEFDEFVQAQKRAGDELYLPLNSRVFKQPRYRWKVEGFAHVISADFLTLSSALRARSTRSGHPQVSLQVERSNALAGFYAGRLSISAAHVYVSQSLLPPLWERGDLGGRSFSVLMTRLPLHLLHKKLDELVALYPERKTFREFRAPDWMVHAEQEALEAADSIVTPHSEIVRLYPAKTTKLQWVRPSAVLPSMPRFIVFPGPCLARKGVYEVRTAVSDMRVPLLTLSATLEENGFWHSIEVQQAGADWLDHAAVIVQPAFLENSPRPLLRALAAGVPVIATPECGLEAQPNLTLVPAGDAEALKFAIERSIAPRSSSKII